MLLLSDYFDSLQGKETEDIGPPQGNAEGEKSLCSPYNNKNNYYAYEFSYKIPLSALFTPAFFGVIFRHWRDKGRRKGSKLN